MNKVKLYSIIGLIALTVITIYQNAGAVTLRFLVWDFSMSKALLLPLLLGAGFVIGWLAAEFKPRR